MFIHLFYCNSTTNSNNPDAISPAGGNPPGVPSRGRRPTGKRPARLPVRPHPASPTRRQLTKEVLEQAGVPENLVRLSVGIENPADIIDDIEQALAHI